MQWPDWVQTAGSYLAPLAIWRGYEAALQSLLVYGIGIALYTMLVFTFYQNISKRDPFEVKRKKGFVGGVAHVFKTGFVFPLLSFLYFCVLAASLFVLAKSQPTFQVMLLAMAVVVGVRMTTFASEGAGNDLAKMLPLALLGVLIVDPSYTSFATTLQRVKDVPSLVPALWRFFALFIVLEGALRIGRLSLLKAHAKARRGSGRAHTVKKSDLMVEMSAER
jgi:hypothetical protein